MSRHQKAIGGNFRAFSLGNCRRTVSQALGANGVRGSSYCFGIIRLLSCHRRASMSRGTKGTSLICPRIISGGRLRTRSRASNVSLLCLTLSSKAEGVRGFSLHDASGFSSTTAWCSRTRRGGALGVQGVKEDLVARLLGPMSWSRHSSLLSKPGRLRQRGRAVVGVGNMVVRGSVALGRWTSASEQRRRQPSNLLQRRHPILV